MTIGQTRKNHSGQFFNSLSVLVGQMQRSQRVHDYTHHQSSEYVFEAIDHGSKSYMTGQGSGICQGDRILLNQDGQTKTYQVQSVEYYASPSDWWTAMLIYVR